MNLYADGNCKVGAVEGSWDYNENSGIITLTANGAVEKMRALRGTNREEGGKTVALTGRNQSGIGVWAMKRK